MSNAIVGRVVIFAKALGTEVRVRIVQALVDDACVTVSALADKLDLSLGTISHHVAILRTSRVVTTEREGRESYVSVAPEALALVEAIMDTFEDLEGDIGNGNA